MSIVPSADTDVADSDVVILGGGLIGTALAWRCAQRGLGVTIVDPDPTRGAWRTAAGMLAPATELHYTEERLLRLGLDSSARWPDFAAELTDEAGTDVGYLESGTVLVAWDGADVAALRDLHVFAERLNVDTRLLTGRELRAVEPSLAAGLPGGLHAPGDHQVDPRRLHAALSAAGRARRVRTVTASGAVVIDDDRVTGVRLEDGTLLRAARVVVAAGAWSGRVAGLAAEDEVPVRPVKGQTVRLRLPAGTRLGHVVRGRVRGSAVYIVPRTDGSVVVGASSEEAGFDLVPRAGAVYELLRDAQALLPELGEAAFDEVCTGLRPGTPDNAPVLGPDPRIDGLVWATGHHRNGVLLAPVTADLLAAWLAGEPLDAALTPFLRQRVAVTA